MKEIHVISCSYSDGSGHTVVRAYESADEAERDMEMFDTISDRSFKVTTIDLVEGDTEEVSHE